jgi:hypothetical protein
MYDVAFAMASIVSSCVRDDNGTCVRLKWYKLNSPDALWYSPGWVAYIEKWIGLINEDINRRLRQLFKFINALKHLTFPP